MKRFHVHVQVKDLAASVRFYAALFDTPPTVEKADYAKWMLEDPRLNFAISQRGTALGVNHLGFQLDSEEEFAAMHEQLAAADANVVAQKDAACCYARSDKYWVTDPTGIAWETYHTLGAVPMFGEDDVPAAAAASSCCAPAAVVATPLLQQPCCTPVEKAKTGCCQ